MSSEGLMQNKVGWEIENSEVVKYQLDRDHVLQITKEKNHVIFRVYDNSQTKRCSLVYSSRLSETQLGLPDGSEDEGHDS